MVRLMLQRGASVNLQDSEGGTALMAAALTGHTSIVQALLDAKADASRQKIDDGMTALMYAEEFKHTATAQLLRQYAKQQAAETEAAVTHAAAATPTPNLSGRHVRISGLKGGADLNGRSGIAGRFNAAKGRYEVAVEGEAEAVLLKPANLQAFSLTLTVTLPTLTLALRITLVLATQAEAGLPTGMHDSAAEGNAQSVTAWLDEGGSVDARCAECHSATLLMAAAAGGQEAMVRLLLQRGASVNLQCSLGVTALMYAAGNGCTTIVQVLLEAKADALLQTNGRTALMVAASITSKPRQRSCCGSTPTGAGG